MAVQEQIVTNRQDPAIEAYRLGLLADVQGYIKIKLNLALFRRTTLLLTFLKTN